MGTLDLKRSNVVSKIRKDFSDAGVVQSTSKFCAS
jgi:hypothetical protein